ncbi:S8 family serine peptidase [Geodermatophilus sp. SYSU D00691]
MVFHDGVDAARVSAEHARASGVAPDFVYRAALRGYAARLPEARIQQLLADPRVQSVQPDAVVQAPKTAPTVEPPQPAQIVSNGVSRVGALSSRTARIDGRDQRVDVDIAVLDTGIQPDHPDLNVVGGVDCAPGQGYADHSGHGTMAAGFAGAIDNAIGRVGVAPGARMWAVRVSDDSGFIADSWLLCGLDWVTANAGIIDVANLSLGGPIGGRGGTDVDCAPPTTNAVLAAVCAATHAGVTLAVAAGNESQDTAGLEPAAFPSVITVSAIFDSDGRPGGRGPASVCIPGEVDDTFAFFSNYGAAVDLAAPGMCISSTYIGSQYAVDSGTSFAAPLVAGAAALYLARNPNATPAQVRQALVANGERGPIPEDPDTFPEPVLNVSRF